MYLQPLISDDRERISRLLRQGSVFNHGEIQVALEVIDAALNEAGKKDYQVFCAFDNDRNISGLICFGPIPMTDRCYDLYWIKVDEAFSRKGVGGTLLAFMEECVAREGARRIYVETSSTAAYQAARSFYKKHGYRLVCSLKDFYREGDHKMIFMKSFGSVHWAEVPSRSLKRICSAINSQFPE
jgi:GNAT superfamily N-acetyltransferase